MLNLLDVMRRYGFSEKEVAEMYARRVLPGAVKIGEQLWFREDDLQLFDEYLAALIDWADDGHDPFGPEAPAPPVYSTGRPAFDPREAAARQREESRQRRAKPATVEE